MTVSGLSTDSPTLPRAAPEPAVPPSLPDLGERLARTDDFDGIFRIVRAVVQHELGRERPGLGLALSNLPPALGAYWPVTGNLIVLNEGLVATMRRAAENPLEANSFIYVILAHEYLHALGYLDERAVRRVTARVTRAAFGPTHPATRMAEGDLWRMFPFLSDAPAGDGRRLKIVSGFDRSATQSYIR